MVPNLILTNHFMIKLIYSEKATKFWEISTVDLSYVVPVKSTVEISQNFVAFSEYMNFMNKKLRGCLLHISCLSLLKAWCLSLLDLAACHVVKHKQNMLLQDQMKHNAAAIECDLEFLKITRNLHNLLFLIQVVKCSKWVLESWYIMPIWVT